MEQMGSLNLMQWDNHILKESDMLFSERNSKTWDDAGQNIKKLRGSIELEGLVN